MRVVITGGAGFIGSHLCDLFLRKGHSVVAVDNFLTGSPRNVEHLSGRRDFRLVERDVSEPFDIAGRIGAVLHFASPASPVDYENHPIETLRVGSLGTMNALELARRKEARFLMASTSEVYGDPLQHPQQETYWGNVNSIGERSQYDEAKRFSEAVTMAWHRTHGVATRIVRIFNTYGPRMQLDDGRVLPAFFSQALRGENLTVFGDGRQTRSFCYVSDLVDGIYRLLHSEEIYPVNLGNPGEVTVLTLAREIIELTHSESRIDRLPPKPDDPRQRKPDISKARRILGWSPKVPRAAGLRKTLSYFRSAVLEASRS